MIRWPVLLCAMLLAGTLPSQAQNAQHHVVIHVDSPNPEVMTEGLHNAANIIDTIRKDGGTVAIEIVANGPGTAMFIDSLSPVKKEVKRIHAAYPDIVMSACGLSFTHTEQDMKKTLTIMPEAHIVPSGAVRIMELEEQHWSYLKP
jgi:uncharacterized protein